MDNSNFIAAVVISLAILVGFHYLYEKPQAEHLQQQIVQERLAETEKQKAAQAPSGDALDAKPRDEVIASSPRVKIETPELAGSVNLKGGRLDDLELTNYRETTDPASPRIILFSPALSANPHQAYYASFGWLGEGAPREDTLWKTDDKVLAPGKPVHLSYDNGHGLAFERVIAVDDQFLFTVTDRVRNNGAEAATLYPFGLLARRGMPTIAGTYVLHEGPIGVLGGTLKEVKYSDMLTTPQTALESQGGWIGVTDKYWLAALIPAQDERLDATFTYERGHAATPEEGIFQTDYRAAPVSLASGAVTEQTLHIFAGAKQVRLLDQYEAKLGAPLFDRAIDFGWYYYLTKPFLYLLDMMARAFGNMGWAILVFTILLKLATLPLSLKSYRSMARLKELQPQIKEIQERCGDDKTRAGLETMELYKREKASPMSGCLPTMIQIPIFFALYKVLYVGIEMRQAPLFGWIHDLSAPDPTSVLTLFGAVDLPFMPHLGVWPILMGISMFLQQSLSPQPPDKSQAQVFRFMPIIFTFMMAKVAAGLIVYWTWSNILGVAQQWFIMHKSNAKRPATKGSATKGPAK